MISVGIDVSKGKSTVCIMKTGGEVLKTPFEMLHSIESIAITALGTCGVCLFDVQTLCRLCAADV